MKLVIIESPYAGDVNRNIEYARLAVHHSVHRDEAPIASHLLFTQPNILDDNIPDERALGISAGLAWSRVADLIAFYVDRGWSNGMEAALENAQANNLNFEIRALSDCKTCMLPFEKWHDPFTLLSSESRGSHQFVGY